MALPLRTAEGTDELCGLVVGAGIKVDKALGPGLLESAYEECLTHEFARLGIPLQRQVRVPLVHEQITLDTSYRLDLVVMGTLVVEVKASEAVLPVHEAQVFTYLRLAKMPAGLLLSFYTALLHDGIKRYHMLEYL